MNDQAAEVIDTLASFPCIDTSNSMPTPTIGGGAAALTSNLPMRKRKQQEVELETSPIQGDNGGGNGKSEIASTPEGIKHGFNSDILRLAKEHAASAVAATPNTESLKPIKRAPMSKAREVRLEQNRKAARESRRRKKIMIEELQRSVVFFSRANSTLKQQNDELQRLLIAAQTRLQAGDAASILKTVAPTSSSDFETQRKLLQDDGTTNVAKQDVQKSQSHEAAASAQAAAQAAATQAIFQNQGFPPAAARAAAQTFVAGPTPASETNNQKELDATTGSTMAVNQQSQQLQMWPIIVNMGPVNTDVDTNTQTVSQQQQSAVQHAILASMQQQLSQQMQQQGFNGGNLFQNAFMNQPQTSQQQQALEQQMSSTEK